MKDRLPRPWSRLAIALGVLSLAASPLAWFYGLPLGLAALALVLGLFARLRGERGVGALVWPLLGLIAGTGVFVAYLFTTDVDPDATQVLDQTFDQEFDDSFKSLVGDESAGFGPVDGAAPSTEDGGSEDVARAGSRAPW